MGSEIPINPRTLRRVALVLVISAIVVTSIVITDVTLAGIEYDVPEPVLSHDFPEIIYFYNISEGVTGNIFSIIFEFPTNHSGHHHIIPREFSLLFWFRDASDGNDLSQFILEVTDTFALNSTLNINRHWTNQVDKSEFGWFAPSHLEIEVSERPDVDSVSIGSAIEIILVNSFGDDFDAHELNVQLEMNVTYSRWWYGLLVNPSHQTVEYIFNLPDDGITTVQSLEFGL